MPAVIKSPTGRLSGAFARAGAGFRFRTNSKDTVYELDPEYGGAYSDDFTTTPFSSRMTLVNLGGSGITWNAAGYLQQTVNGWNGFAYHHNYPSIANGIWQGKFVLGNTTAGSLCGLYLRINLVGNTGYFVGLNITNFVIGTCINNSIVALDSDAGYVAGQTYYIKAMFNGTLLKAKYWPSANPEPVIGGPDNDGYQLKVTDATYASGFHGVAGKKVQTGNNAMDDYSWNGGYNATSPVLYDVMDGGKNNLAWSAGDVSVKFNISSADLGTGAVKFAYSNTLYGAGDENTIDGLTSGDWLVPNGSDIVSAPAGVGRYQYILYQFNSDGTQQTSLTCYPDGQDFTISGGSGVSKLKTSPHLGG